MQIIFEYLKDYPLPVLIIFQIPLVFSLIYASRLMYREIKSKEKSNKLERIQHKKELKELNEYVRDNEKENLKTLNDLIALLEDVETNQKIIISKIDKL
jgi:hypothetical protein|tara:strand:+ start:6702 stop:6998 length:297 start_codon:yes stop_codon:yes gene_type:complete